MSEIGKETYSGSAYMV